MYSYVPAKDLEVSAMENSKALQKENDPSSDIDLAVDPNIVNWDGPNDPVNPMNRSGGKERLTSF